jgi:hypothetical protein
MDWDTRVPAGWCANFELSQLMIGLGMDYRHDLHPMRRHVHGGAVFEYADIGNRTFDISADKRVVFIMPPPFWRPLVGDRWQRGSRVGPTGSSRSQALHLSIMVDLCQSMQTDFKQPWPQ